MSRFTFFPEDNKENIINSDTEKRHTTELQIHQNHHQRFQLLYASEIFALNSKALDIKTESIWNIKEARPTENGYLITVEVEKHEVFNSNSALEDVIGFSKLFNIPLQELVLRLDNSGTITEVLNQDQIYEKWEVLKSELKLSFNKDADYKTIVENSSKQFTDTLSVLQNTLIYSLFFAPVYGHKEKEEERMNIHKSNFNSQLFQDKKIPYTLHEKTKDMMTNEITLTHKTTTPDFNKDEFKGLYDKFYKDAMGNDFDYNINYTANYTYDLSTGLIKRGDIDFNEQVNKAFFFKGSYSILKI